MGDVAKEGRTVLFVSHNMQAISTLTRRSLLLSQGRNISYGPTPEVITKYLREGASEDLVYTDELSRSEPRVTLVALHTSYPNNIQENGQPMELHFVVNTPIPINGAALSFQVFNSMNQPVIHLLCLDEEIRFGRKPGVFELICQLSKVRLYLGQYNLTVHFAEREGGRKFSTITNICPFEVVAYGQVRDHYWHPGTCTYIEDSRWIVKNKSL